MQNRRESTRDDEMAVLILTCKTSILKPWDANTSLATTCVSIMLKTDNTGTGQPGPNSPLAPSPPLPLKEDRKDKKPQQLLNNMKISLQVFTIPIYAYFQKRQTVKSAIL